MADEQNNEDLLDLGHILGMLLRRRYVVLCTWILFFAITVMVTWTKSPIFESAALLLIEKERGTGGVYSDGSMVENKNDDYYQTQYKLLQSRSLATRAYAAGGFAQTAEFGGPAGVDLLIGAVTIQPVPRSRLLYVRASSTNPDLAARVANALSDAFVTENVANQLFISKEILQSLEVDPTSRSVQEMYSSLPQVVNNTMIQGLKSQAAKVESEYSEMSQRLTPKHPTMLSMQSNMATLKAQIKLETSNVVQSLKSELSGQLKGNNVRVVDPALVPTFPSKPNKRMALLLGFVGGLLAGLLMAYIIELLDQSIRSQANIETRLKLPCLGTIPNQPVITDPVYSSLIATEPSLTSESFRNLRTLVDFAAVGEKSKHFLITSSVQEEGKSYLSSNLSVAYAQSGEKVLLIDGDLRRSKIHKNFRLSSKHGLSTFLAKGAGVDELASLTQRSEVPNLDVLVCGTRPPNPSELLNTPRMHALLAWANSNYDRVIVDCTPAFPINDTLLWGRHIKAAIFVCHYGKTRIPLIREACRKLRSSGIEILGLALNGAKAGGLTYSGYGYYYHLDYKAYVEPPVSTEA